MGLESVTGHILGKLKLCLLSTFEHLTTKDISKYSEATRVLFCVAEDLSEEQELTLRAYC